jgi:GNAT superfamily N-acetyltransferase
LNLPNKSHIREILPHESSRDFISYYGFPEWMRLRFEAAFDAYRRKTGGLILLMPNPGGSSPCCGCLVYERTPDHFSYGQRMPTFGWLKADSGDIAQKLLAYVAHKAIAEGFTSLRGPINSPKTFGGWGVPLVGDDLPPLIECAWNKLDQSAWLTAAGFTPDAEYINLYNTHLLDVPAVPDVELTSPPIDHILSDRNVLEAIGGLVNGSFAHYLPDTSAPTRALDLLGLMQSVPQPEDFYLLAWERSSGQLIGYIFELPNFYQLWQGVPLTMSNTDSVILHENYRGAAFFHYLYNQLAHRLHARGIHHREGTLIWTQNHAAVHSFRKIGYEIRRFGIYAKKLA